MADTTSALADLIGQFYDYLGEIGHEVDRWLAYGARECERLRDIAEFAGITQGDLADHVARLRTRQEQAERESDAWEYDDACGSAYEAGVASGLRYAIEETARLVPVDGELRPLVTSDSLRTLRAELALERQAHEHTMALRAADRAELATAERLAVGQAERVARVEGCLAALVEAVGECSVASREPGGYMRCLGAAVRARAVLEGKIDG